ncbi:hypothetical protein [Kineococcus rhizosphaerae]|uniref:Very-short-patch-repair endonuclease n=1 Tax=Kineococcus rhizosphaerae TaxID=559628 RepID=A0A2T0R828_9ACTN|nr:hypothetical protein [Kineococcus rhizosphaerae]PRY17315.1 hypothetical protein CLV37_102274 [Kineococcus rhizosphaerae]
MPRHRSFDTADVDALLARQDSIATHRELQAVGLRKGTISRWIAHGPWQRVVPGVIAGHRGRLSVDQRRRAALAYCGPHAVLSGVHALDLHGLTQNRIPVPDEVLVLIPWSQKRLSSGFVVVERTQRRPDTTVVNGCRVASPSRAAADASRHGADVASVREIFGQVLQQRRCTVGQLRDEVFRGPRQRSAPARLVVGEVADGTRSAAEGEVRAIIAGTALPQPLWNEAVVVDGVFLGLGDAYWPELGVVLEVDGFQWHSSPSAVRRTQAKQRRYAEAGLLVMTTAPHDVRADPQGFLRQLTRILETARRRR